MRKGRAGAQPLNRMKKNEAFLYHLPHCKKNTAGNYPAPESDRMDAHPEPDAVEQLIVLKHSLLLRIGGQIYCSGLQLAHNH